MKEVLKYIKDLNHSNREIYIDGWRTNFTCDFNEPATLEEIEHLENEVGYKFPEDFRKFLLETNGICFLGYCDHWILGIEDIKMIWETNCHDEGVYVIGCILEDYVMINSKEIESGKYMYVSPNICPDEGRALGCNFETFLKRFTNANFSKYWDWFPIYEYVDLGDKE